MEDQDQRQTLHDTGHRMLFDIQPTYWLFKKISIVYLVANISRNLEAEESKSPLTMVRKNKLCIFTLTQTYHLFENIFNCSFPEILKIVENMQTSSQFLIKFITSIWFKVLIHFVNMSNYMKVMLKIYYYITIIFPIFSMSAESWVGFGSLFLPSMAKIRGVT